MVRRCPDMCEQKLFDMVITAFWPVEMPWQFLPTYCDLYYTCMYLQHTSVHMIYSYSSVGTAHLPLITKRLVRIISIPFIRSHTENTLLCTNMQTCTWKFLLRQPICWRYHTLICLFSCSISSLHTKFICYVRVGSFMLTFNLTDSPAIHPTF